MKCTVYEGWPSIEKFRGYMDSFTPFLSLSPPLSTALQLESLKECSVEVDVSCVDMGKEFIGIAKAREYVKMKLSNLVEGCLELRKSGEGSHWTHKTGLNLFLSQVPIYSHPDADCPSVSIKSINVEMPHILHTASVETYMVNIWLNLFEATSSLHYDANHNLLRVVEGRKVVVLISPHYTSFLQPYPAHLACSPNHSSLSAEQLLSNLHRIPHLRVEVQPNNVLFIPEGWWHFVQSDSTTFAVNYWFRSSLHSIFSNTPHMLPYILRASLNSLVSKQLQDIIPTNKQKQDIHANDDEEQASLKRARTDEFAYIELEARLAKLLKMNHSLSAPTHSSEKSLPENNTKCEATVGVSLSLSCSSTTLYHDDNSSSTHHRESEQTISTSKTQSMRRGDEKQSLAIGGPDSPIESISKHEGDEEELLELQDWLVSSSYEDMVALWPRYAREHSVEWTQVLLSLRPAAVHKLTTAWDMAERWWASRYKKEATTEEGLAVSYSHDLAVSHLHDVDTGGIILTSGKRTRTPEDELLPPDNPAAFFASIYAPCGESTSEIRTHLINQVDKMAALCASKVQRDVLGFS